MKKFIVKSDGRQFKVKATDYESAIKAVSLVKDSKVDEFLSAIYAKLGKYLKAVSSNSNSAVFTTLGSKFPFIREMASKYGVEVRFGPEDTGRFTLRLTDDIRNEITINGREYDKIQRNDIVRKYGLNVEFMLTTPFARSAKAAVYVVSGPDANKLKKILGDSVKDEASPLQTVNALLEDERAAVDAYNVALENLKGKIPDESYAVIEAIRNDENRHIENLQAVVNGTVTEKNLEDSVKDKANMPNDVAQKLLSYIRQRGNVTAYITSFGGYSDNAYDNQARISFGQYTGKRDAKQFEEAKQNAKRLANRLTSGDVYATDDVLGTPMSSKREVVVTVMFRKTQQ